MVVSLDAARPAAVSLDAARAAAEEAVAEQALARKRLSRAQRELARSSSMSAMQEARERNRRVGKAVRTDLEQRNGLRVARQLANVTRASEEEVRALSMQLNTRMQWHQGSEGSWYQLFKIVDEDGSGKISISELERLVRVELQRAPPSAARDAPHTRALFDQ